MPDADYQADEQADAFDALDADLFEAPPEGAGAAGDAGEVREAQESVRQMIELIESDGRYPLEAYRFLQEGLEFTVGRVHGETDSGVETHVGGRQLCLGLADYARDQYGLLASEVLRRWGIVGSGDFGEMVFFLVNHGFFQKTDDDCAADFEDVFQMRDLDAYAVAGEIVAEDVAA